MSVVRSEFVLPRSLEAPHLGRDLVGRALEALPEPLLSNILLVLTELVTNSVRHAEVGSEHGVEVKITVDGPNLTLNVCDPGNRVETELVPEPRGEGGWGLLLVDRLAARWGVIGDGHTCVWAEFDLAGAGA